MSRLPHLTQFADRHLTDAQMFGLLDEPDRADATTRLHLVACPNCQTELRTLRASLTNFRAAATSLASAETPALASTRVAAPASPSRFRRQVWATSLAAVAVLAIAAPFVHPVHKTPAIPAAPGNSPVQPNPAAESDDALLDGIQRDLSTSIPPSLEPLAVPAQSSSIPN